MSFSIGDFNFAPGWKPIRTAPVNMSIIIACTWRGVQGSHWFRGEAVRGSDGTWTWINGEPVSTRFSPPAAWQDLPAVMSDDDI